MDGLLLIDKPAGMTSMDVIRRLRRILQTRKLGHTGTLDPAATGLLPVTVGRATKLAKYCPLEPKEYSFEIVFGALTETADDEGAVVETGHAELAHDELQQVCTKFVGLIDQRPPRYSAVKIDGKRAYELARAGVPFELPLRQVQIAELRIVDLAPPVARMQVTCGTGTYVRSLAVDIAEQLGTVAHARFIRRHRVGVWTLEHAQHLDEVVRADMISPREMLAGLPSIELSDNDAERIAFGQTISSAEPHNGFVALVKEDELVAVGEADGQRVHPRRVMLN